jgi:thioesterase domain-containing protein
MLESTERNLCGKTLRKYPSESTVGCTTEKQIQTLYQEMFGINSIGPEEEFPEFNDDGLQQGIAFLGRINEHFDRSFGLSVLAEAKTPASLALLIDGLMVRDADLIFIGSSSDAPPLICFAATEECVLGYRTLHRVLRSRSIYILRPPHSLDGKKGLTLNAQVTRYVELIQNVQVTRPCHLIGAGNAGILAYETAQQLAKAGMPIAALVLIDTPGPDAIQIKSSWRVLLRSRIQALNTRITQRLFRQHSRNGTAVPTKGPSGMKFAFRARMKSTGEEILRKRMRRTEQLTGQLIKDHAPSPYSGRVTLFRSSKLSPSLKRDLTLGWRRLFPDGNLVVLEIPSYYGSMLKQPFVGFLAAELRQRLER